MLNNIAVWTWQDFKVLQCVWLLFNIMNERVKKITQGLSQRYLLLFALSLLVVLLFLSLLDKSNPYPLLGYTPYVHKSINKGIRTTLKEPSIGLQHWLQKGICSPTKNFERVDSVEEYPKKEKNKKTFISSVILGSLSFSLLQQHCFNLQW